MNSLMNSQNARNLKVGDTVYVNGHEGKVISVRHEIRNGVPCTYFQANFDEDSDLKFTSYNGGSYGSADEYFTFVK